MNAINFIDVRKFLLYQSNLTNERTNEWLTFPNKQLNYGFVCKAVHSNEFHRHKRRRLVRLFNNYRWKWASFSGRKRKLLLDTILYCCWFVKSQNMRCFLCQEFKTTLTLACNTKLMELTATFQPNNLPLISQFLHHRAMPIYEDYSHIYIYMGAHAIHFHVHMQWQ